MARRTHTYAIRLAVEGGGQVKAELVSVGQSGEQNLKRIESAGERASGGMKGLGRQAELLRTGIRTLGGALIGVTTVGGLAALVDRSISAADTIGKTADQIGVGVEALPDVLDFSITFPGEQSVHSSGAEDGVITINYEYVVRHEADDRAVAILRKLQQLEYQADLRIKFASLDAKGRYVGDAGDASALLFTGLPAGWRLAADPVMIETRCAATRRARLLTCGTTDVAAVEHETGVEFMLPIVGSVVAAGAYDLIRWGLNRWIEQRKAARAHGQAKAPTFLEIERTRRDADGQILQSETVRLRGPVADADLRNLLERLSGD